MRSVAWLMSALLRSLDFHQKALEFRGECIRIIDGWRNKIRKSSGVLTFVLGDSSEALMDLEANLVDLFTIDHHWLDAFGDHRLGDIFAADTGNFYFFSAVDPDIVRQLSRNFNEWFGYELYVHRIVFRPVVVMLGHAVSGADDCVAVLGRTVFVVGGLEPLDHGIVGLLRMQRVINGALGRFVEFRERAIREGGEWAKDSADALGIHDEGTHVILRLGVRLEVRHIVADPFLRRFAP